MKYVATEKGKLLSLLLGAHKEGRSVDLGPHNVITAILALMGDDPECETCRKQLGKMNPRHDGSKGCESGSIASGGTRSHCTCDVCF